MLIFLSFICLNIVFFVFFFFNDTATTEIYTLSLHDALPISPPPIPRPRRQSTRGSCSGPRRDRKSTRLNSSHLGISYAVFCLKKKKQRHRASHRRHGQRPARRTKWSRRE